METYITDAGEALNEYMENLQNYAQGEELGRPAAPNNLQAADAANNKVIQQAYQEYMNTGRMPSNIMPNSPNYMRVQNMINQGVQNTTAQSMIPNMAPVQQPQPTPVVPQQMPQRNPNMPNQFSEGLDPFEELLDGWVDYAVMPPMPGAPQQGAPVPNQPPMPGPIGPNGMPVNMPQQPGPGPVPPMPQGGMPGPAPQGAPVPPQGAPAPQGPVQLTPNATVVDGDGNGGQPPMVDPDGAQGPLPPMPVQEQNGQMMIDPDGNGPAQPVPLNVPQGGGSDNSPKQVPLASPEGKELLSGKKDGGDSEKGIGLDGKPTDNPVFKGMTPEKMKLLKAKLKEIGAEMTDDGKIIFKDIPKEMADRFQSVAGEGDNSVAEDEFNKGNEELADNNKTKSSKDDDDDVTSTTSKEGGISKTPGLPGLKRNKPNIIDKLLLRNSVNAGSNASGETSDGELAMNASEPLSHSILLGALNC